MVCGVFCSLAVYRLLEACQPSFSTATRMLILQQLSYYEITQKETGEVLSQTTSMVSKFTVRSAKREERAWSQSQKTRVLIFFHFSLVSTNPIFEQIHKWIFEFLDAWVHQQEAKTNETALTHEYRILIEPKIRFPVRLKVFPLTVGSNLGWWIDFTVWVMI